MSIFLFRNVRQEKSEARKSAGKWSKLDELVLPNAKLRFCPEQLLNLNYIFNKRLHSFSSGSDKSLLLAISVTERLIQRLLCGAGMMDSRFASKYLICDCDKQNNTVSNKLSYMVRLDCLSTPCIYENDPRPKYSILETESDYPPAYARIKLQGSTFKVWSDYINSSGYLRRDKVQARLVELLATAASKEMPITPLHVDESIFCGIPGKIVDSFTLYNILKVSSDRHVYYGPGGKIPRYPDPRDFRLAIVDEPNGIRLRVEFLSPALSNITIDVRILVAIGVDAWPSSTDFPTRVPLGHSDCLLYHQAAQTGMFLVGFGVQSSAWQIRVPAAEYVILNHYGPNSTVNTILDMLYIALDDIDNARGFKKQQLSYTIITKYMVFTLLLEDLERNSKNPIADMMNWSPMYLSTHVLNLLDKIIPNLKAEKHPHYFFKKSNLMVNPGHLCDDDFVAEANNVKAVLVRLFDESLMSTEGNEEFDRITASQESEMILLFKWKDLIEGLLPPPGTRGRKFCFAGSKNRQDVTHTQYTSRQLEYIGLLLKKMLKVRQNLLQVDHTVLEESLEVNSYEHDAVLEDIIFILVTIMDQARDQYLTIQTNPNIQKKKLKIKSNFNTHTSRLVDLMRKDKELLTFSYEDDLVLVKVILKWLYKAMDQNKRYLGPILRPYLNNLFSTSHAVSWHIDSIKQRNNSDELFALGSFAQLVNSGRITPAQGLIDCVNKHWTWARSMLSMIEKSTLRVVFIADRGKVFRHILSLPSYQRGNIHSGSKTLDVSKEKKEMGRQKTLPSRNYFQTILSERFSDSDDNITPQHDQLRNTSPLNLILSKKHRRGEHRGAGDIFRTLMSMQKLNLFQEVTSNLPEEDRLELSKLIQSIQTVKSKRSADKRWSGSLPQMNNKSRISPKNDTIQKYTPKEESAGIKIRENDREKKAIAKNDTNTLIGTCRAVRIREDNSVFYLHESFKIKALLNKSESFRF